MRTALLPLLIASLLHADEPKPADGPPLTLIDAADKTVKLKAWTFTEGTRRLGWLADPEEKPQPVKGKRPPRKVSFGPEALVLRDAGKFNFAEGVLALVPLSRLRAVEFDPEKRTMIVKAVAGPKPEDDVELSGTTLYKMLNKVTLEADVDKGVLGVASVTYQGGIARGGFRSLRFNPEKFEPPKPGRAAVVETADKDLKRTFKVTDLMPLYRLADGREVLSPTLLFKKTLRLDVSKIASLAASSDDSDDVVWTVNPRDGEAGTLTLLTTGTIEDQAATLIGLVGTAPYGYRLFPVRRIVSVAFDAAEVPRGTLLRMPRPLPDGEK